LEEKKKGTPTRISPSLEPQTQNKVPEAAEMRNNMSKRDGLGGMGGVEWSYYIKLRKTDRERENGI
jgi:hypothetical protein